MKTPHDYLMENTEEAIRLDVKTDPEALVKQARWCGVKSGMRILDMGCGAGKTTALLHDLIEPDGSAVGVDFSPERMEYARKHYGMKEGLTFIRHDLREPLTDVGTFDLISGAFCPGIFPQRKPEIVRNLRNLSSREDFSACWIWTTTASAITNCRSDKRNPAQIDGRPG
jgi:SAM-dependent methyltransferase